MGAGADPGGLLFAHWSVPVDDLRAQIPDALELDTHDGRAHLGLTPFKVTNLRLRGLLPVPVFSFLELNCRTYVSYGGEKPGIWFFSLDASSRLAVEGARRLYRLPYFRARMSGPPHRGRSNRPSLGPAQHDPAAGLDVAGEPYVMFSARQDVLIGPLEPVD